MLTCAAVGLCPALSSWSVSLQVIASLHQTQIGMNYGPQLA